MIRRIWGAIKFVGRWLGPVLMVVAGYLFIFPPTPFGDPSGSIAIAGAIVTAAACLLMRVPERRRHRTMLAIAALSALIFGGWRHWDDGRGFRQETVSFDNRGARLVGTLYLPDRPGKVPGIVIVHGSGPLPRLLNSGYGAYFARRGYAVLSYDKRGIGDSTGRYTGGTRAVCPDNVNLLASDASAALSHLAQRPEVRADALGFAGGSQAGWIIPRAAVSSGKAAFMLLFVGPTSSTQSIVRLERLRLGPPDSEAFSLVQVIQAFRSGGRDVPDDYTPDQAYALAQTKAVSFPCPDHDPMTDLRALDIPGLWVLGEQDWIVPFGHTSRNLDILRKLGKPYQYRKIPGAGHGLAGQSSLIEDTIDPWLAKVTSR